MLSHLLSPKVKSTLLSTNDLQCAMYLVELQLISWRQLQACSELLGAGAPAQAGPELTGRSNGGLEPAWVTGGKIYYKTLVVKIHYKLDRCCHTILQNTE